MGMNNSPLYNINEKKLTVIGTRKEKNPDFYEAIKNDSKSFRKTTGWNPGSKNYEYIMYAWLFAEKKYGLQKIRDLYKKSDKELTQLFSEYHQALKDQGSNLPVYLAGIYKKTVARSKNIILGRKRINSLNDAADVYKETFWFFKMYSGMKESLNVTNTSGSTGAEFIEKFKIGIEQQYLQDEINKKNLKNIKNNIEDDTDSISDDENNIRKNNDNSLDDIILDVKESIKIESEKIEEENGEEELNEEEELIQDKKTNYYDKFKKEFDGINDIAFYFQKNFEVVADKNFRTAKQACHFTELKKTFNDNFRGCRIESVKKNFDYRTRVENITHGSMVESVIEEDHPELITASKKVLEKGDYDKQFDYSFYSQFRGVRDDFIVNNKDSDFQAYIVGLTKDVVETTMRTFNNRHRHWISGPDSTAMSDLKKSCKRLLDTKPYGRCDDSFPSRYIEALYDTLNKALEYKVVKDEQGRDTVDRTQMGKDRYTANDGLIKTLIKEIKRADSKLNPIYEKMKYNVYHPKINFRRDRLIGERLLRSKTETFRRQNHTAFLFCGGIVNYNMLRTKEVITNISDLEKVLEADNLYKEYAHDDLYTKPAFINYSTSMNDIYIPKVGKTQPNTKKKIEIIKTGDEDDKTEAITHKNDRIIINPEKLKQQSEELLKEKNSIINVMEYRKEQEKQRREVPDVLLTKEQYKKFKQEADEAEAEIDARKRIVMVHEYNQEIQKRYDKFIKTSGKDPRLITKKEKEEIKNTIIKKFDDEMTERQVTDEKIKAQWVYAKKKAIENEAVRIQQRVNKNPFQFLLDEMENEVNNRKSDLNDVDGIIDSAYKSFYYHAIMDEYARKLGVDPNKSNELGAYPPEVIREQLKKVTPEVKKDANQFLKCSMLYGIEQNTVRIFNMKSTIFGRKFKSKIKELSRKAKTEKDFSFSKHLSHTGILKLRDEVMMATFQSIEQHLYNKKKNNDKKGEKNYTVEIQKHKMLTKSFASKVVKDNNEVDNKTITIDVGFDKRTPKPIGRF